MRKTTAFCSNAKICLDSETVRINLDFDTLASPICQILFEIYKFKYRGLFFQEPTLGQFLRYMYQFYYFHDILDLYNCERYATY